MFSLALFEELLKLKQVPGVLSGKQVSNSMYVPSVYSKSQSDWVDQFYAQNGFLGNHSNIKLV